MMENFASITSPIINNLIYLVKINFKNINLIKQKIIFFLIKYNALYKIVKYRDILPSKF